MTTGPFGVEITKSVKSQLKLVKETKGFKEIPKAASSGLKRIGSDDVKRAKLNMAGAQARRQVNGS